MSGLAPIDVDANGVVTRVGVDRSSGDWLVQQSQDVEPIMEINKKLQTLDWKLMGIDEIDARLIGMIPFNIALEWAEEWGVRPYGQEHLALCRRKVHDSDFQHFRSLLGNYI